MATENLILFSSSFKIPEKCFNLLGLSIFPGRKRTKLLRVLYMCYFWFQNCLLLLSTICVIIEIVITMMTNNDDYAKIVESFIYINFPVITHSKLLAIYNRRNTFQSLVNELDELFPKTNLQQKDMNVNEYVKHTNLLLKTFTFFYFLTSISFTVSPFIETYSNYFRFHIWNPKLPYHVWVPYDKYTRGVYELNYIVQAYLIIIVIVATLAVDILFCSLCSHICFQFEKLQKDIVNVISCDNEITVKVHKIVEMHEKLHQLSGQLDVIYSFPLFVIFCASAGILCFSGYTLLVTICTVLIKVLTMLNYFL